jgi:cytochrome b
MPSSDPTQRSQIYVWDLGVRLFHWLLVCSVAAAFVSGNFAPRWWLDLHLIAGTCVAALIIFRIVWGFTGSTYARFTSFVVSPIAAVAHLLALLGGRGGHHIGHNPIGALMILALLSTLMALIATGVVTLGGTLKDGPLATFVPYASGEIARQFHHWLGSGLLGLIGVHVAGVLVETLRTKENLITSMVTGRKDAPPNALLAKNVPPHTRLAAALVLALFISLGAVIAMQMQKPPLGVPTAALDPVYVKECAACHSPHHPSLAPASTWRAIIATLGEHFGDNAELDPAVARTVLAYLLANSSDNWDTKAANRLRTPDPQGSSRITLTAGWQEFHHHVSPTAFTANTIGGKLNCDACHRDASIGHFQPRSIKIPTEVLVP